MTSRIPVTIITGWLGAGKTTLLNHLINGHPNKRFAIIENEFGDISIDHDLVVGVEDGIFELSNGCICCSLNGELIELLNRLLTGPYEFDHLLVETTGIADPSSVAAAFVADYHMQTRFKLDGTIALADAQFVEDLLDDRQETAKQLAFADVVLLNKVDTVAPHYVDQLHERLGPINPYARMVNAKQGVPVTEGLELLNLNAYDAEAVEKLMGLKVSQDEHHHDHGHHHGHDHEHDHAHGHDHIHEHNHEHTHAHGSLTSLGFTFTQPFDWLKFQHWVQVLLMIQGAKIYRAKGLLSVAGEANRIVFQSVKSQATFSGGSPWPTGEARTSRLVIIGEGLKRAPIQKALNGLLAAGPLEKA